jgi:hypothetical protein
MEDIFTEIKNFDKKKLRIIGGKAYYQQICGLWPDYDTLQPMNRLRMAKAISNDNDRKTYKLNRMDIKDLYKMWCNI